MRHSLVLLPLILAAACGGSEFDDALEGDDFGTDGATLADTYDYRCVLSFDQRMWPIPVVAWVRVQPEQITLSRAPDLSNPLTGSRDPGYTRQPTKDQFDGFNTPVGFPGPSSLTILKTMRSGTGPFRVGGGGGYVNMSYFRSGGPAGYASYFCRRLAALPGGAGGSVTAEGIPWPAAHADAMVRVANDVPQAQLHSAVGLTTAQASAVVAARRFTSLLRVAAVTGIGAAALRKLDAYATAQGWVAASGPPANTPRFSPKAMQWMGPYSGAGALTDLALRADGWYMAMVPDSRVPEIGTFVAAPDGSTATLPSYTLQREDGFTTTVRVTSELGDVSVTRSGSTFALSNHGFVPGPQLCGDSGGTWSNAPTAQGVRCTCPADRTLMWTMGGCAIW